MKPMIPSGIYAVYLPRDIKPNTIVRQILKTCLLAILLSLLLLTYAVADSVTLAWDANDPAPSGYRVYQRTADQPYDYSKWSCQVASTSCTIDDLAPDTTYFFVVRAYIGDDVSGDSNEVSHTTGSPSPSNRKPGADAGPDQTVGEITNVTLDGSNSKDPDAGDSIASFQWRQVSGTPVQITNAATARARFTTPNVGIGGEALEFELKVTDQSGASSIDRCFVNVTRDNKPPQADAGNQRQVSEGDAVILDGSGSSDPDNDPINFVWMQIAGPTVALSDARTARPKFSAPDVGTAGTTLKFQLTVTDDSGLKDTDTCVVNVAWVNSPPKADAGSDQNTAISNRVTLDGSNSKDPDDGIATYKWRQTEGLAVTLSNADNAEAFFDAPEIDQPSVQLTFTLTVTDTHGLESEDSCLITIYRDTPLNQAPLADAGDTQAVISGQLVYLDGTGSSDPDGNLDRYQWTQTAGSAVTISDPSSSQPSFVAPQTDSKGDSLAFELTVFDTQPLLSKDTCWVEVQPALNIDIDGDGHGDNDDAFPEDPAEWLDTDADGIGNNADDDDDDDGMPDSWESEHNLNPLNPDDAHMDSDGDGLTNLIEFQGGTNPTCAETSGGWTPVVTSPSDGDTGLSVNGTTVRIDTNGRPDHNVVVHQTLWQILSDDGRMVFFSIISDRHVSKIRIPHMILAPQTAYLCRVRCYGADNSVSDWSQTVHFMTKNIPNDHDLNGVPDDQEVTIGPNPQPSDTIPANLSSAKKSTIVSVDISAGNENATISSAMYVDPTEIEEAPDDALPVPLSMAANKVTTEPGEQVSLRFYFDTPQTSDALRWIKYDNIDGWQDYTNYTRLEQNGRAMDVTLQDGGNGDADGAANGTIINLSGPAHAGLSNSNTTLTGASSGQCFIKSLR